MARDQDNLNETLLIYYSEEDQRWVAHGLRTDQIGDGESMLGALVDAMRAIDAVFLAAHDDPTLASLREAPEEIQKIAKDAKLLPRELYEIAYRRVRGSWPDDMQVEVRPKTGTAFKTEIREEAVC